MRPPVVRPSSCRRCAAWRAFAIDSVGLRPRLKYFAAARLKRRVTLQRVKSEFLATASPEDRVALGGFPPRAPTDPYVRDYRIRFLRYEFATR
jgi:hypothetical protein